MSHRLRVPSVRNLRLSIGLLLAAAALVLALQASPTVRAAPEAAHAAYGSAANGSVAIVDFAFNPGLITITVGSSVEWTNTTLFTHHTTTSDTGLWNSNDLAPGGVYSTTFAAPGDYDYHCEIHPSMQGRVVVLTSVYLPFVIRS